MTDTDMLYMASLEKRNEELEAKLNAEAARSAEYEARAEKMRDLLRESLPVLHRAFFANYKDTNAANELYDKIKAAVGGAE